MVVAWHADGGLRGMRERRDRDGRVGADEQPAGERGAGILRGLLPAVAARGAAPAPAHAPFVLILLDPLHLRRQPGRRRRLDLAPPQHGNHNGHAHGGVLRHAVSTRPLASAAAASPPAVQPARRLWPRAIPERGGRRRGHGAGHAGRHLLFLLAIFFFHAGLLRHPPRRAPGLEHDDYGVPGVQRGAGAEACAGPRRGGRAADDQAGHLHPQEDARAQVRLRPEPPGPAARRGRRGSAAAARRGGGGGGRTAAGAVEQPAAPYDIGAEAAGAAQRELRGAQRPSSSRIKGRSMLIYHEFITDQ